MNSNKDCKDELLIELKRLLNKDRFSTQLQLANALQGIGFNDISQAKVARLIKKTGAIKIRDNRKSSFYQIPENPHLNIKCSISSVVMSINHNNTHVVIKTVKGGALVISQMIESQSNELGILGCLASCSTILIIPMETKNLDDLIITLIRYLN
ncbi:MAG: transcriptional regulator of arginine metabolism [Colwellia sp.]|jgi:transcriptional regulator of arginine metabolism